MIHFLSSDYCAVFCTPSVTQSSYLNTVGEKLLPGIDVLWTGKITLSRSLNLFPWSWISPRLIIHLFLLFLFFIYLGPKVVSHKISVESIEEVSSVLKRAPVIWDNIHANDYDPQRLFLGPYKVIFSLLYFNSVRLCVCTSMTPVSIYYCFFSKRIDPLIWSQNWKECSQIPIVSFTQTSWPFTLWRHGVKHLPKEHRGMWRWVSFC